MNTGIVLGLSFFSNNKQHFANVNCMLQCLKWKYLLSQMKLPSWMGRWWSCFCTELKGVLEISQIKKAWDLIFFLFFYFWWSIVPPKPQRSSLCSGCCNCTSLCSHSTHRTQLIETPCCNGLVSCWKVKILSLWGCKTKGQCLGSSKG